MKPPLYPLLTILCFLFCFSSLAQSKKPLAGKEPSWVTINQYDYNDTQLNHEAENGYFDIGYEQQVSLNERSFFIRSAMKILTEAGIQNCSEVSVGFDPSYEQLTFHSIKVIRGNRTINQLNLSKIKTIQQEKELDRYIYNGTLSAVLFLEDVRKGDIVEYSYTIKGFNPVFQNKFARIFDTDFGVPIGTLYYKLIVPKDRQVTIKNSNINIAPGIQNNSAGTVYEWKLNHVKALRVEEKIPSWYDPYSMIMISEYKSWKEVNDWAMNLFPAVNDISPALKKKIGEINKQFETEEERVLAAIRFVQDDVRYMGIEMGQNSHKPANPNKIFAQRFGDCKDKSYLLCVMLQQLGIKAFPVLINTGWKGAIMNRLPSAFSFDHATVQLELNNKQYWLDPTISFQRGGIDAISYPDYQCGLVIQPGTEALTTINRKEPGMVVVKEIFDIPDLTGKAKLRVTTHYTGSFADDMRSDFNNNSAYEMQKTFKEYYASYYKGITADSIGYTEDEKTGAFITKEYYTIDSLWETMDGIKKASFDPYVINGIIKRPKDAKRNMPLALVWPAKYREEIEINLPEDWSANESTENIHTASFSMKAKFSFDGRRTIYLEYEYENLKDHIPPGEIAEYTGKLDSKNTKFSYELSQGEDDKVVQLSSETKKEKDRSGGYTYVFLALLLVGGIIWWTQRR